MIVECPKCEKSVKGIIRGEHQYDNGDAFPVKAVLLACPNCGSALLASQEIQPIGTYDGEWVDAGIAWPQPNFVVSWEIPGGIRHYLVQAYKCYKASAYDACAGMCGTTIEAVCKHFIPNNRDIEPGIKKLSEMGIIDAKLFEWSDLLRLQRNLGVHVKGHTVSKEDAGDLLDFANAVCEYVFVLPEKERAITEKYKAFHERAKKRKSLED